MRIDGWAVFETYRRLPVWLRVLGGTAMIVAGFALARTSQERHLVAEAKAKRTGDRTFVVASRDRQAGFQIGLALTLIGSIVVMTSDRSRAEQNGYRF